MSYSYLIKLKPLEPFFFGGEYTFGADESRKESSRYSATSTQFPQQTALLGMLRKTMLIQNGNLTMHRNGEWVDSLGKGKDDGNYAAAKALVGSEAFSYQKTTDLGSIENLSPLFIEEDNKYFIANSYDDGLHLKEHQGNVSFNGKMVKALTFENYHAKTHQCHAYIAQDQTKKNYSDFFEEVETVGIDKSKLEEAFFRKKSYFPKKGATFMCILTLSSPLSSSDNTIVSLGADNSSFALEIAETTDTYETLFNAIFSTTNYPKIVLTSEALVSKQAYESCLFVFAKRTPYRQLINASKGLKSKRYYLLEQGSVLYTNDIKQLEKQLNKKHLQKIGINHYIALKGQDNV